MRASVGMCVANWPGPWVDELRSCWRQARKTAPMSRAVVDLSDVTSSTNAVRGCFPRCSGRSEFVAAGVETKHLLENLKAKGERPLRRSVGHLTHRSK